MTCIIGFIDKKNEVLHMIADSLGSNGYTGSQSKIEKIFVSKDSERILIGSTGSMRQKDVLRYNSLFDEKDIIKNKDLNHEYMVTKFIPSLQTVFDKSGIQKTDSGILRGGNFLIGTTKNLYEIQPDFSVVEAIAPFDSVGCGEDQAKASLFTTKDLNLSIKERLILAIKSAEEFSVGVRRPFIYMNTNGEKETIK